MLVKSIIDNAHGTRWDIIKQDSETYIARYSELLSGKWIFLFEDTGYTRDALELMFDISIA